MEDLFQVGTIGLIKALENFDPNRNAAFSTFARHHILGELRHYLRDKVGLIKPPRWLRYLTYQVLSEKERLLQKLGREPTTAEIAEGLNLHEDGVTEVLSMNASLILTSLDDTDEMGFDSIQNKIKSVRQASFQLPIEDRIVLEKALEKLLKIERKAIDLFFYQDLTQTEIGQQLHLSQRAVSRLIARGLRTLKSLLTKDLW